MQNVYYAKDKTKQKKPSIKNIDGFFEMGRYLLSRVNSTIGANGLNFSVRNGERWIPVAKLPKLIEYFKNINLNNITN